ncbi:hypothetical protein AB0C98_02670 [Streptomyces sp. NPDC048558]
MGYSEVEQAFGQFIGVRQHEAPFEQYWEYEEYEEYVSGRSGDPDAYGQ